MERIKVGLPIKIARTSKYFQVSNSDNTPMSEYILTYTFYIIVVLLSSYM